MTRTCHGQVIPFTVCDSLSRQPIPGTSVYALHHRMGTVTDANGHFSLSLHENDTIVLDHLAYELRKIRVSEGIDTIWLKPKSILLQETLIHTFNVVQMQPTGKKFLRKLRHGYGQPLGCLGKVMKSEPVKAHAILTGVDMAIKAVMNAPVAYRLSVFYALNDNVRSRDSLLLIAYYDGLLRDSDQLSKHSFDLNTTYSPPRDGFIYIRVDILDSLIHSKKLDSTQLASCKDISIGMERTRQEYVQICSNYSWDDKHWYSYNALGKFIEQRVGIPMENNTFMVRMRWKVGK